MSLTDELQAVRDGAKDRFPGETLATMNEAIEDLSRSGILDRSLKVGDKAPDFALPNANGETVRLSDLLEKGPVVISFYRGGWCTFCAAELNSLQASLLAINSLGASLIAISPQTPENCECTSEDNDLTYELLSDRRNKVASAFGIVYHLQDEMKAVYKEMGLELPEYNDDDSFELPVPATYVVDNTGEIRVAFVDPDYTKRMDPTQILAALRKFVTSG